MKQLLFACLVAAFVFACNSGTESHDEHTGDTAQHDGAHAGATNNVPTNASAENPMMQMHNAMNGMMDRMKNMQMSGDADHDFAMMMKEHHKGAIDMANIQIQSGTDSSLKGMAQKMVEEQQKENLQLDQFMSTAKTTGQSDYGKQAMQMMTPMDKMKMEGGSIDAMFASMMIPHHEDAVKMSDAYLKVGKSSELKKIASDIKRTQPKEVQELKQWLAKNKAAQ